METMAELNEIGTGPVYILGPGPYRNQAGNDATSTMIKSLMCGCSIGTPE